MRQDPIVNTRNNRVMCAKRGERERVWVSRVSCTRGAHTVFTVRGRALECHNPTCRVLCLILKGGARGAAGS